MPTCEKKTLAPIMIYFLFFLFIFVMDLPSQDFRLGFSAGRVEGDFDIKSPPDSILGTETQNGFNLYIFAEYDENEYFTFFTGLHYYNNGAIINLEADPGDETSPVQLKNSLHYLYIPLGFKLFLPLNPTPYIKGGLGTGVLLSVSTELTMANGDKQTTDSDDEYNNYNFNTFLLAGLGYKIDKITVFVEFGIAGGLFDINSQNEEFGITSKDMMFNIGAMYSLGY